MKKRATQCYQEGWDICKVYATFIKFIKINREIILKSLRNRLRISPFFIINHLRAKKCLLFNIDSKTKPLGTYFISWFLYKNTKIYFLTKRYLNNKTIQEFRL